MTQTWTQERVARLTELWDAGTSASLIGKALGVSKNAVAGKVHRMRLESRPWPIIRVGQVAPTRKVALRRTTETVAEPRPQPNPISEPIAQPEPVAPPRRACQFIEGEKGRDFTLYADAPRCPAAVQPGSSYCPVHDARCHRRQPSEAP